MAANGSSFVKVQRNLQRFTKVLTSAACEWFLIFLLLINATLSYLLTKFASYCRLQIPCIFCSRLDHIWGNEKPGFYKNLLCSNHRSEISSLISCQIHGNLTDGHGMCEECLLSFTVRTKTSSDMHKLFMGNFGFDMGTCGLESSLGNKELVPGLLGIRTCSCCNKAWRSRQSSSRTTQLKSVGSGMTKPNIPLPRRLSRRESIKKMRDRFPGSATSRQLLKCSYDRLTHVGYSELRISSDSESEFPFSDNEEASSSDCKMKEPKIEPKFQHPSEVQPRTLNNDTAPEKMTYNSSKTCIQPDISEPCDVKSLASDAELNQLTDQKEFPSPLPELISLDDFPSSCSAADNLKETSSGRSELKFPLSQNHNRSALYDLMSLMDVPTSFNVVEASRRKYGSEKGNQVANVVPPVNSLFVDLTDAWKPAASGEKREASGFMVEEQNMKVTKRMDENLKELPADAPTQELDLSSNNSIGGMQQGHGDKIQMVDALRSTGSQKHQMEKAKSSGLESLDGSFVSEIEGENIIDQLKRQVEYDRKHISALYEELEEERNASAIAANQAMAMITRLQEEKAALHMEALQYLRMMEEQAEYDVEALEKANDLLAEKEKEIQDLESDIEYLRSHFTDESIMEKILVESFDPKGKNASAENSSTCYNDVDVHPRLSGEILSDSEKTVLKSSLLECKDEILFISQCLKDMKRKLHQFTHHGASESMSKSDHAEETAPSGVINEEESPGNMGSEINRLMKENLSTEKAVPISNGSLPAHIISDSSIGENRVVGSKDLIISGKVSSKHDNEKDLVSLGNEISNLNVRLEALEFDRNFLELTFNSLQYGKEGLKFVQEIAHHLQELRKIGMR